MPALTGKSMELASPKIQPQNFYVPEQKPDFTKGKKTTLDPNFRSSQNRRLFSHRSPRHSVWRRHRQIRASGHLPGGQGRSQKHPQTGGVPGLAPGTGTDGVGPDRFPVFGFLIRVPRLAPRFQSGAGKHDSRDSSGRQPMLPAQPNNPNTHQPTKRRRRNPPAPPGPQLIQDCGIPKIPPTDKGVSTVTSQPRDPKDA